AVRGFPRPRRIPVARGTGSQGRRWTWLGDPLKPAGGFTARQVLRRQDSSNGEDKSVHKLVVHHHHAGIQEIHPEHQRPKLAEPRIEELRLAFSWVRSRSRELKQAKNQPGVQAKTNQPALDCDLQVSVVKNVVFGVEIP